MKKYIPHIALSIGYLLISWGLLFWLNFSTQPDIFAHLVAIPSLVLFTGYSANLILRKGA